MRVVKNHPKRVEIVKMWPIFQTSRSASRKTALDSEQVIIVTIYFLNKYMSKNSIVVNNEQDRKAQSALTTAPKEFKYRYINAKQLMKFS